MGGYLSGEEQVELFRSERGFCRHRLLFNWLRSGNRVYSFGGLGRRRFFPVKAGATGRLFAYDGTSR